MTPISTVVPLFWVAPGAAVLCLVGGRCVRATLKAYWKTLAILLVLTLVWRIPVNGVFFHGLECEDSYIYTVAGRQMADHVGPASLSVDSPYSINTCEVGSLKTCQRWELFPEHLIGYARARKRTYPG